MIPTCLIPMLLVFATLALAGCAEVGPVAITTGQGDIAGEVTTDSVILQSRLTTGTALVESDLPGAEGVAHFEVARPRTSPTRSDPPGSKRRPSRSRKTIRW